MAVLLDGKEFNYFIDVVNDTRVAKEYLSSAYRSQRLETLVRFSAFKKKNIDYDFSRELWVSERVSGLPSCKQVGFGGNDVYKPNKKILDGLLVNIANNGNNEKNYVDCLNILERLKLRGKISRIPFALLNRAFVGFYPEEHVDWVSMRDVKKLSRMFSQFDDFKIDLKVVSGESEWFTISKAIRDKANVLGHSSDPDYIRFVLSYIIKELRIDKLSTSKVPLKGGKGLRDSDASTKADIDPPKNVDEKAWIEIRTRRGQGRLRRGLILKYKCCNITGCEDLDALEAAHIQPHSEGENYSLDNGLLLRSDIHTLFDLNLIGIDKKGVVHVASKLKNYSMYNGRLIHGAINSTLEGNLKNRFGKFKTSD